MKYCKKCLDPDTRPTTSFDKSGICLSCRSFELSQKNFNENNRYEVLNGLLKKNKKKISMNLIAL